MTYNTKPLVNLNAVYSILEETEVPVTVAEIIERGGFANSEANRREVKAICDKLVDGNLAGSTHPATRFDKEIGYTIIPGKHDGIEIKKRDDSISTLDQFVRVLVDIELMSECNDHAGALRKGAELMGVMGANTEILIEKLDLVTKLHNLEGSLPSELSNYRYNLYRSLLDIAKRTLNDELYNEFYNCF